MSTTKEQARAALARSSKIVVDHGEGRLEVMLFSSDAEWFHKRARRALGRGATVTWEDGTREYWISSMIVDVSKEGSEQYTWDATGNLVLHETTAHLVYPTGERGRRPLRRRYKSF